MSWSNRVRLAPIILAAGLATSADASSIEVSAGHTFLITKRYETRQQSSNGNSGSSNGTDRIVEKVIAVRDDGIELEYDLPNDADAGARAREWTMPARVFLASRAECA
ncbi:hypothetical protein [Blastomonas sp. AAP53]|uniref:hypothetical protein n=1 Tax=Blastomonas sp. AAP53 TaxID=1248760 RepID=UPI0003600EF7|nr:hypothetical protein [Blastomonas sp. AAP53]